MESIIFLIILFGIVVLFFRILIPLIPIILVIWVIGYFLGKKNQNTDASNSTQTPNIIDAEYTEREDDGE